jgi:hypothetical protein
LLTGILCALGAALAAGTAVVLQAVAARRIPRSHGLDVRLGWRLIRSPTYIAGLALTGLGFLLALVALRQLPLFLVQAARASSLGVTAGLAVVVFGTRLGRKEWAALAGVGLGLTLLGFSATQSPAPSVSLGARSALLLVLAALAVCITFAARARGPSSGYLLGFLAGVGFATLGIGARTVVELTDPAQLVSDPAAWTIAAAAPLALMAFALAVQQASVTGVTATMVATETLLASAVGLVALGDTPMKGEWPLTVVGFAFTLVGALVLTRVDLQGQRSTATGVSSPTPTG